MNKFFEFHKYTERQDSRPYYRGTWDKLKMENFRLLPFQIAKEEFSDSMFSIYKDTTDITDHFISGSNLITSWTRTGSGAFSSTGSTINSWTFVNGEYITSNTFSLSQGDRYHFRLLGTHVSNNYKIEILDGVTVKKTVSGISENVELTYKSTTTSVNYTVKITASTGTPAAITNATTELKDTVLDIYKSDNVDYVSYHGEPLFDFVDSGECYFNIKLNDYSNLSDYTLTEEFYSEDCDVCRVNTFLTGWTKVSGLGDITTDGKDLTSIDGEVAARTNSFYIQSDQNVYAYFKVNGSAQQDAIDNISSAVITNGTDSTSLDIELYGEYVTITGLSGLVGLSYLQIETSDSLNLMEWDLHIGYSNEMITVEVSSTVDYGGIHYADGFTQKWYKEATVRRSPSPQITVIGDDPDGVIIKEKVITATKYNVRFKVTEAEFNALLTATAGTVTITDQTGHEFTCNSPELAEPSWSQGNGVVEFSFLDNVSIHTLNNSLL